LSAEGKTTMELGIIGLGRMGANMTERLVLGGHRLISFDRSPEAIQRVVDKGALGAHSLADFVKQLSLKVIAALRNEFGGHAVKKG
jgi:6-phosphogluconate dehydrogenase (decarboxylating)